MATAYYMAVNGQSLFLVVITEELGISRSSFSFSSTMAYIAGMLAAPLGSKYLLRGNARKMIGFGLSLCCLSIALQGLAHTLITFYILSAFRGFAYTLSTIMPFSVLTSRWFARRKAFATSIIMAGSGLGGMLFAPLITGLMQAVGWRNTLLLSAVGCWLITVPLCFIIVRDSPESVGLRPYGENQQGTTVQETGAYPLDPPERLRRRPLFSLFVFALFCVMLTGCTIQHIPAFVQDIGFTPAFAATIVSIYSAFNIVAKMLMGVVFDRFGTKAGVLFGMGGSLGCYCMMLLAYRSPRPAYLVMAALFYGVSLACQTLFAPTLTNKLFGSQRYEILYGSVLIFTNLGVAISNPFISTTFDLFDSYVVTWSACLILSITALVCFFFIIFRAQKVSLPGNVIK